MKNVVKLLIILTLVGGMFSFSSAIKPAKKAGIAQAHQWTKLGFRKVNMTADHDEILVTAHKGFFTKLKFKVLQAPIMVRNVRVVFGNGEFRNIKFNRRFAAGTESRVVDLPGNKRIIKKIIMNYTTVAKHKGRATVVVFGRR